MNRSALALPLVLIAIGVAGAARGQSLVRDINPKTSGTDPDSTPAGFVVFGNLAFFSAKALGLGTELWVTDGTEAGTRLVADIRHGSASSNPGSLSATSNAVYFVADDGVHGRELWRVDAQLDPRLVTDLRLGPAGSNPANLAALGATLYFTANDLTLGVEMWRTQGTAATTRVRDIYPGAGSSSPSWLTRHGTWLYFAATHPSHGRELWVTDGQRTALLADIRPGKPGSGPTQLTSGPLGMLYFAANDVTHGNELWITNGTKNGTKLLADIATGTRSSFPKDLTVVGNDVYMSAYTPKTGRELYRRSRFATTLGRDIRPGGNPSNPIELTAIGTAVYFSADNGTAGRELWKASAAGANLLKDTRSGAASGSPSQLVAVGSRLYFRATDTVPRLWTSDGFASGTTRVSGGSVLNPTALTRYGNRLLLSARKTGLGVEPHTASGTSGSVLANLAKRTAQSSGPAHFFDYDGTAIFAANDGISGSELWRSDGTLAGTTRIRDIHPGAGSSLPMPLGRAGDWLVFAATTPSSGRELWRTDGTTIGTTLVKEIASGSTDSRPATGVERGGYLFFQANDGSHGPELWKTDGTNSGTRLVKDANPGPNSGLHGPVVALGSDEVFFVGNDGVHGFEPWKSDGTAAGTKMIVDTVNPGSGLAFAQRAWTVGRWAVFQWNHPSYGLELWRTDGTPQGTAALDLIPGTVGIDPLPTAIVCGKSLYFVSHSSDTASRGVWRTDGTPASTARIHAGSFAMTPGLACVGDFVLFSGIDQRPYYTDGTAVGTHRLRDIALTDGPFPPASPVQLGAIGTGGHGAMTAAESGKNFELWITDGTTAGTTHRMEIHSGGVGSRPRNFATVGDKLFFVANDGVHGHELWMMPISSVGASHRTSYGFACAGSVRTPRFAETHPPRLGKLLTTRVERGRPNSAAVLALGITRAKLPVAGCTLRTLPVLQLSRPTDSSGTATLAFPIPNDPSWLGRSLFLQSYVLDPGARWFGMFSATAGQQAIIGR